MCYSIVVSVNITILFSRLYKNGQILQLSISSTNLMTASLQLQFSHTVLLGAFVIRDPDPSLRGSSLTPIFLSGLGCEADTHSKILDCNANRGTTTCSHDQDVVVHCDGKLCSTII